MTPFSLPHDYCRIRRISSFQELVSTPFGGGINALCWPRTLTGDFDEVMQSLSLSDGITTLDDAGLLDLPLSILGRAAVGVQQF